MKKKTHRQKLEKKRKRLERRFYGHEMSSQWVYHSKIASNKIHIKIIRPNKFNQPVYKRVTLGLKDKLNFNTFLKI